MSDVRPLDDEPKPWSNWADDAPEHAVRVYVSFLQETFQEFEGKLAQYRFSYDPQSTKINISSPPPIEAARVANVPAIVVDNPGIQPAGSVIGDVSSRNLLTGEIVYVDYFSGALPVYVISDNETTAKKLSWLVHQNTWTLRNVLIGNGRFHAIGRSQMGPPSPVGELVTGKPSSPLVSVPLIVPFLFAYKSSVKPINKRKLEGVDVTFRPHLPTSRTAALPPGWRVEDWITKINRERGYETPTDPLAIPALPTETVAARESGSEVVVEIDVVD